MKTKTFYLIAITWLMCTGSVFAQAKTENFKIYGNCESCEKRIESAAKSVQGVNTADWNKDTKMMAVTYDSAKTNAHMIQMAVAKAGHDTEMHKAPDDVYNALPACCKYERAATKKQ